MKTHGLAGHHQAPRTLGEKVQHQAQLDSSSISLMEVRDVTKHVSIRSSIACWTNCFIVLVFFLFYSYFLDIRNDSKLTGNNGAIVRLLTEEITKN